MAETLTIPIQDLLIDQALAAIDVCLADQLAEIVAHSAYKRLQSLWLGLYHLVDAVGDARQVGLDLLSASKDELIEDFDSYPDPTDSGLFHHLYKKEYDQAGGIPYTSVLLQFEFGKSPKDISLMRQLSKVAAACHSPFIVNTRPELFGVSDISGLEEIQDFDLLFEGREYDRWRTFSQAEDTRYLGMALPRIRVAYPWRRRPPRFCHNRKLAEVARAWSHASYAFGIILVNSFVKYGWCVYLRGPKTGGLVAEIESVQLGQPGYHLADPPLEIAFSDTIEQALAAQGFIPLCFYRTEERICVFSAPTLQNVSRVRGESGQFDRLAASLPYLYLISRIAHYQKAIQRENIGMAREPIELEKHLNKWLKDLVITGKQDQETRAKRPLSGGFTKVLSDEANPGFFRVQLVVKPHLQLEGVNARLELNTKMPREKE